MLSSIIRFFLENKLVTWLTLLLFIFWGMSTAPFEFGGDWLPKDPVPVDAIPDIGENQQIVFTKWQGRSPQDVEDQISYPLTTALLGIPGVKSIRSNSMFGFSTIYIIFKDDVEFYWSRSRILEKLNSLPPNTLPEGVQPALGPDATALGQIFWYTLEGRDKEGRPTGGWDLHELRSIQDFYLRFALSAAEGVAEVASIGGYVQEYQVDVNPDAMKAAGVSLEQVMAALRNSNLDIGARTMEINRVEYFVRGLGYVKSIEDIENSVVVERDNTPIRIKDIAFVQLGPAPRRGALDKAGAEAVGGVVVARYGSNPLAVIQNVKEKIREISPGLPSKVLEDGTVSQVSIVPFYDRTQLIKETIGTLEEALTLEVLITIIVVILMLMNLRASLLVSAMLPVAILMCFIAMRYFGVDANIVALSGIAIAIGTMVDMGIVLTESMVKHLQKAPPDKNRLQIIYEATMEVASAVITAVATTIVSFLPVFTMQAAEGKLFRPLAFTKTFALVASIVLAVTVLPALAHTVFRRYKTEPFGKSNSATHSLRGWSTPLLIILAGAIIRFYFGQAPGFWLMLVGVAEGLVLALKVVFVERRSLELVERRSLELVERLKIIDTIKNILYAALVAYLLSSIWMPLGVERSTLTNFFFVALLAGVLLGFFWLVIYFYERILRFCLRYKLLFLIFPIALIIGGYNVFRHTGQEFMPSLGEGSFLLMPTSMPHSGMEENLRDLKLLDMAVNAIPEVETVVGKLGRVESPLDPAPISMYENVILYKSEYKTDEDGHRLRFKVDEKGEYLRDEKGQLIPDPHGQYFRQWRDHIRTPDDIWNEIVKATKLPGVTSAPKLQPIETRLVMLQTGMRAPMGIKVRGPNLKDIEAFGLELEKWLREVDGIKDASVFSDRIIGKPYLLIDIKREQLARYGLTISQVQRNIQAAVGGMKMSETVEGRERYAIRLRYPRELRDDPEILKRIYIRTAAGNQIPLSEVAEIRYEAGPQSIKSEDGFLIGYVLFDREPEYAEVEVVHNAQKLLEEKIASGELTLPPGVSYRFAGNYENQVRASKRLSIVLPIALMIIFLILYFEFKSVPVATMIFSGVFIAFSGGFVLIWLYGQDWFMNFDLFGVSMRELFQMQAINLSVAVWVGFLALFGIATDDGVLVATFLRDSFRKNRPDSIESIREAVVEGGKQRVRPAMMTTATTILALLPVLSSTGRGADIMLPMALPSFGGMLFQSITMFTVPVLYSWYHEMKLKASSGTGFFRKSAPLLLLLALPVFMQAQPLDSLVARAERENLQLRSGYRQYLAKAERPQQLSEWPDPQLNLGIAPLPIETRLGPQWVKVGASQKIPWQKSLDAQAGQAESQAMAAYYQWENSKLNLAFFVKRNFLQYYELYRTRELLERQLELYHSLERLSLARLENGRSEMSEVLRIQLEISRLEKELELLPQREQAPLAQLNALLSRSPDSPLEIEDSLEFAVLPFNGDSLKSPQFLQQHPYLEALRQQQEASHRALEINELAARPDIVLGLDYLFIGQRNDADPQGNGRDVIMPRAGISLPLYRKKYGAKEREETYKIAALEDQKSQALYQFEAEISAALAEYEEARLTRELYTELHKTTQSTIELLTASYSSKGSGLDEIIRLQNQLVQYERMLLHALVQSHLAKAKLERFIPEAQ